MRILYQDADILVCIKPPRVLSTDEVGGLPELIRDALGNPKADVRTVHRLDRVVSGVMVLARSPQAASNLSAQIREDSFEKDYLAVVHGHPESNGTFVDLLQRDKRERKTYVVNTPAKGVQEAILDYERLGISDELSKVAVYLRTGRTHQIRVQFSSRGFPIVGDRKYSLNQDDCEIALWSHRIAFSHPASGERMSFSAEPPEIYPWHLF